MKILDTILIVIMLALFAGGICLVIGISVFNAYCGLSNDCVTHDYGPMIYYTWR